MLVKWARYGNKNKFELEKIVRMKKILVKNGGNW